MRAVGVDIGGTKIAFGLIEDATVVAQGVVPTPASDPEAIVATVASAIADWLSEPTVGSVGVAAAGFIDAERATILRSPNLAWRNEPLAARLSDRLGCRVVLENDANAAAWGEFMFGAGRGIDDFVLVTVGTGLGGGIIAAGRLLRGAHGTAAEIGHVRFEREGRPCGCGQRGCWEQYASGSALKAQAEAQGLELAGLASTARGRALLGAFGERLGEGAADLAAVLDPHTIAFGGGVMDHQPELITAVRRSFARRLPAGDERPHPLIVPAELGNDAGIIGAAHLARTAERPWRD